MVQGPSYRREQSKKDKYRMYKFSALMYRWKMGYIHKYQCIQLTDTWQEIEFKTHNSATVGNGPELQSI